MHADRLIHVWAQRSSVEPLKLKPAGVKCTDSSCGYRWLIETPEIMESVKATPLKTVWRKILTEHLPPSRVVTWKPQTELWPGPTHSPLVWCTGYSWRRWRRTAGALPRSRKPLNQDQRHASLQRMNTSWGIHAPIMLMMIMICAKQALLINPHSFIYKWGKQ